MSPYLKFVENIQANVESAKRQTVSGIAEPVESEQKVLLFSPHPDDECITGLLPLRLMREAGMQIINVPVTYGSNVDRQPGRTKELADACAYLGWDIFNNRKQGYGNLEVEDVVFILKEVRPDVIMFPHSEDWNSRHIATHFLLVEALEKMPTDFSCAVIETEYWGAMDDPNLMVEGDAETVADLVAALSLHAGEVARNPYHLSLPAWMQDNVRRGGERVGGQGAAVPVFTFATLYRWSHWKNGQLSRTVEKKKMISMNDRLKEVLGWK